MALSPLEAQIISLHERIHRRSGHVAILYKNRMIVWGGYVDHSQQSSVSSIHSAYHNTDEVWVYNCLTEIWERKLTKGDIPPRNSGACGVQYEDYMYIFGGFHGIEEPGAMDGNSNQLFRLHLITWTWEWLHPMGEQPVPCDKLVSWLYDSKLYFFGGFGPQPDFGAPFQHVIDPSTETSGWPRGWNNQLVVYNPALNRWEWPKMWGPVPSPRAAHAADVSAHKVYVFGGRFGNIRNNELHCLDMQKMCWSGNLTRPCEMNPEGRSWHSLTFISSNRAVVYGGLNQTNNVLSDCWFLDIAPTIQWCRYQQTLGIPRLWHKAQYVHCIDELLIVGGHRSNILDPLSHKVEFETRNTIFNNCVMHMPKVDEIGRSQHSFQDALRPLTPHNMYIAHDCWALNLTNEDPEWAELELPYDHGEPRCSHMACFNPSLGELLIHSGSTQPYYETCIKLKDHAEELLVLHFTPKSLLRLCMDVILKHQDELKCEWAWLPRSLETVLQLRLEQC